MRYALALLLIGCGSDPVAAVDAPPAPVDGAFEKCLAMGGAPMEAFNLNNFHAVQHQVAIGNIVLNSTTDKQVKQWSMSSGSGDYGAKFTETNPTVVTQLAANATQDFVGVDGDSILHRWTLQDPASDQMVPIGSGPLVAVALNGNGSTAVVGSASVIKVVALDPAVAVGMPVTTALTEVTALAINNAGVIVDGGAKATHPLLETRTAASPMAVAGMWTDDTIDGKIRALAMSLDGTRVIAAGDNFVAVFDPTSPATPLKLTKNTHPAVSVTMLPEGKHFVTVGSDNLMKVWDVATGAEVKSLSSTAISVVADPNGMFVYTGGGLRVRAFGCQ